MNSKQIGFWSSTSLVVGNMIGSGIFLMPSTLAAFGGISIIGWIISSLGTLLLAIVFGNLGRIAPNSTGGPYAYTRLGLGEFPAFLVAWGYWISIWSTNAAIAVALVGYLEVFFSIYRRKYNSFNLNRTIIYLAFYLDKFKETKNHCHYSINNYST